MKQTGLKVSTGFPWVFWWLSELPDVAERGGETGTVKQASSVVVVVSFPARGCSWSSCSCWTLPTTVLRVKTATFVKSPLAGVVWCRVVSEVSRVLVLVYV